MDFNGNYDVLVSDVSLRHTKNSGEPYYSINFAVMKDGKPSIESGLMFSPPRKPEEYVGKCFLADIITEEFHGRPSVKIKTLSSARPDIDPLMFVVKANLPESVRGEIKTFVSNISDLSLRCVMKGLLKHYGEKFLYYPGAIVKHHAYYGGLIEHSYRMFKIALGFNELGVDTEVIASACLAHDMGKIDELEFDKSGLKTAKMSANGVLFGHIVMLDQTVCNLTSQLSETSSSLLNFRHCLLAHHGKPEWGSPVYPHTREAMIVHQIDMIDSRLQMANEADRDKDGEPHYSNALEAKIITIKDISKIRP